MPNETDRMWERAVREQVTDSRVAREIHGNIEQQRRQQLQAESAYFHAQSDVQERLGPVWTAASRMEHQALDLLKELDHVRYVIRCIADQAAQLMIEQQKSKAPGGDDSDA